MTDEFSERMAQLEAECVDDYCDPLAFIRDVSGDPALDLSPEVVEERVQCLMDAYPGADRDRCQYIAERACDELVHFIVSDERTPREKATFLMVLTTGHVTKEACHAAGFDSVVTRDLTKYGVVFRSRRGTIRLMVKESNAQLGGGLTLPTKVREAIIAERGQTCVFCGRKYEVKRLSLDHEVPHRVAGNQLTDAQGTDALQVLCYSCNNRKQKACLACPNQNEDRDIETCLSCHWADPSDYTHVATIPEFQLILVGEDRDAVEEVRLFARKRGFPV